MEVDLNKLISIKEAVAKIKDGSVLLFGGFLGCGSPHKVIDALIESGVKDLTIVCNDTAYVDMG
ncbi:MAG: CoA-transferase, partial [Bacillota bacterium]|nr:CoA-transferase [Bacillota bacterium]